MNFHSITQEKTNSAEPLDKIPKIQTTEQKTVSSVARDTLEKYQTEEVRKTLEKKVDHILTQKKPYIGDIDTAKKMLQEVKTPHIGNFTMSKDAQSLIYNDSTHPLGADKKAETSDHRIVAFKGPDDKMHIVYNMLWQAARNNSGFGHTETEKDYVERFAKECNMLKVVIDDLSSNHEIGVLFLSELKPQFNHAPPATPENPKPKRDDRPWGANLLLEAATGMHPAILTSGRVQECGFLVSSKEEAELIKVENNDAGHSIVRIGNCIALHNKDDNWRNTTKHEDVIKNRLETNTLFADIANKCDPSKQVLMGGDWNAAADVMNQLVAYLNANASGWAWKLIEPPCATCEGSQTGKITLDNCEPNFGGHEVTTEEGYKEFKKAAGNKDLKATGKGTNAFTDYMVIGEPIN